MILCGECWLNAPRVESRHAPCTGAAIFVSITVGLGLWMEKNPEHFLKACVFFATAHVLLLLAHTKYLQQFTVDLAPDDTEEFPQTLGLRDT